MELIVTKFNIEAKSLLKNICVISPNSYIAKNYNLLTAMMDNHKNKMIELYIVHVLKYKDKIDNFDDDFFLNYGYEKEVEKDTDAMGKIFEFKKLWSVLSKENKKGIFQVFQVLCYYAQQYFILVNQKI